MIPFTFEQRLHANVTEGEADDGGFVQMSPDGRLEWQEARQIAKDVRLHSPSPSGRLAADRSANGRDQRGKNGMNV